MVRKGCLFLGSSISRVIWCGKVVWGASIRPLIRPYKPYKGPFKGAGPLKGPFKGPYKRLVKGPLYKAL